MTTTTQEYENSIKLLSNLKFIREFYDFTIAKSLFDKKKKYKFAVVQNYYALIGLDLGIPDGNNLIDEIITLASILHVKLPGNAHENMSHVFDFRQQKQIVSLLDLILDKFRFINEENISLDNNEYAQLLQLNTRPCIYHIPKINDHLLNYGFDFSRSRIWDDRDHKQLAKMFDIMNANFIYSDAVKKEIIFLKSYVQRTQKIKLFPVKSINKDVGMPANEDILKCLKKFQKKLELVPRDKDIVSIYRDNSSLPKNMQDIFSDNNEQITKTGVVADIVKTSDLILHGIRYLSYSKAVLPKMNGKPTGHIKKVYFLNQKDLSLLPDINWTTLRNKYEFSSPEDSIDVDEEKSVMNSINKIFVQHARKFKLLYSAALTVFVLLFIIIFK